MLRREQWIGLLCVLALHGAALYGLWSSRVMPAPVEAVTLMVSLINPPPSAQPKPPRIEPSKPPKQPDPHPPEHRHLVAAAPPVKPDEPVAYAPPPPSPPPVIEVPPLPPQPVQLSGELSVVCPERSPPNYTAFSMRMNEQGKAVLRVELGEDGRIANAEVKTSSGYRRLDDAALATVKAWRCTPSVRDGVAVRVIALQPFNFILEGK